MSSTTSDQISKGTSAFHFGPPARHEKQGDFYDSFDLTLEPVRERRAMVAELWARKRAKADLVVGSVNTQGETLCGNDLALTPEDIVAAEDMTIYSPNLLADIPSAGPDDDDEDDDGDGDVAGTASAAAHKGAPHGDPGYRRDGKKRYPLANETTIRAAHAKVSDSKVAIHYSVEQLAKVRARVAAAWRKTISKDGPPADAAA